VVDATMMSEDKDEDEGLEKEEPTRQNEAWYSVRSFVATL
jgi:hypothetical protein